ncbi:hypothetical protein PSTG_18716, partial [Puccinia striiformis f. sp. tritici PST-78]
QKTPTTSQKPPTTSSQKVSKNPSDEQSTTDQAALSESNDSKAPRSHNYGDEEDLQICKSWLDVSQDPLNSTNQAADTFWTRVAANYTEVIPDTTRTWSSIKSRWQLLQHAVNSGCGCVEQVDLAKQSGTTVEDRFVRAMQLYQALSVTGKKTKKPKKPQKFTHMACYHVLCKAEKWKQHRKWLDRKEKEEAQKSRRSTPFGD